MTHFSASTAASGIFSGVRLRNLPVAADFAHSQKACPSETNMRLTSSQIVSIRHTARTVLGPQISIRLFESRARNDVKGGDIDLLFENEHMVANRAPAFCSIQKALMRMLGDRKIDILLKDLRTPDAPIFETARRTGVIL